MRSTADGFFRGMRAAGVAIAMVWCSSIGHAASLDVTGIDQGSDLYDGVLGGSLLREQTAEDAAPSTQELLAAAQADYARVLAVLYDRGYFAPVIKITVDGVDASAIAPVSPPAQINRAVINIQPGKKFTFAKADISPVAPETELPDGFAVGQPARLGILKDTVSKAITGWRDQGHAKAILTEQRLTARVPESTISAALRLDPGPRLRFGELTVKGTSAVRRNRIYKIAGLPTGQIYSQQQLDLAATRLRRTGAFSSVAMIEADQITAPDILPITAQIADAPPRRFGFGAELSSLEGVSVSSYWMHRNLLGGAENLRIEGEVSGIGGSSGGTDYRLSTRFERPATFNADTNFYAFGEIEQLDEVNFFSRQLDLETGIERIASAERTYSLGVGVRTAETRDAFGTQRYTLLTLPLTAEHDYRDNRLDAKDGFYAKASMTPFLAVSGSANGLRSYVDLRGYKTFGTVRPVTFALRGQLGSVYGPTLAQAPADYLFYSGGGGSVRGQPYQTLGVDLSSGDTVGGRSFAGLSAEARVALRDKIGIVAFVDAGYVGSEEIFDGSGRWHSGAGIGLRYATGIGPIRVDFAVPTSGPETDENFQVYIGIGQSF
ncbi:autotransporter secretion outer membrane protein TamA [Sulfitobacter marinus]|uniref:Autotransporter secretion outer membrane protein TamA n=1 Tax=Sulfitobacter marinus TaxID=394264 RepID=A0A1I6RYK9_9RHOB|nr:autotransporter assembly complex family protein [Sulfitobacter marinus]SFS69578.1 autotransporter secretion outer membrane protein TamA [Sulfitobacter marinus]